MKSLSIFRTLFPGAGYGVVLLAVEGQGGKEDVCWFDNLGIYRLEELIPESIR